MKITMRPKGATDDSLDVVLADGADRADDNVRGPARADISVSIAVQPHNGIRADSARFYSRANRSGSYGFTASRRFASLEDAGRFILLHGTECPAEGTLIFDFGDTEATPAGNMVLLHGACIRQIGPMQQTGVHIATGYQTNYSLAAEVAADDVDDAIVAYDSDLTVYKINTGADVAVGDWLADVGYTGGEVRHLPDAEITNYGNVPIDVYRRYRVCSYPDSIVYTVTRIPGVYDVFLHLCAHYDANNYTVDIKFGGSNVASGYDIKAMAGGALKAKVFSWTHTFTGTPLVITMTPNGSGRFGVFCGLELRQK